MKKNDKQVERIKEMEKCLDESAAAIKKLEEATSEYEKSQKSWKKLCDYYGSTRWMEDYEADEEGTLPKNLKRGVLSEDAVYNLIEEHKELTSKLLSIIAKTVKD